MDVYQQARVQKIKLAIIAALLFLVWAANGFHWKGMFK